MRDTFSGIIDVPIPRISEISSPHGFHLSPSCRPYRSRLNRFKTPQFLFFSPNVRHLWVCLPAAKSLGRNDKDDQPEILTFNKRFKAFVIDQKLRFNSRCCMCFSFAAFHDGCEIGFFNASLQLVCGTQLDVHHVKLRTPPVTASCFATGWPSQFTLTRTTYLLWLQCRRAQRNHTPVWWDRTDIAAVYLYEACQS